MYKFDIDRIDLYKVGVSEELTARTKNRLNQMANMGMEEVGFADFGIKGVMSGLYIEKVWGFDDTQWDEYIEWVVSLINKNPIILDTLLTKEQKIAALEYARKEIILRDSMHEKLSLCDSISHGFNYVKNDNYAHYCWHSIKTEFPLLSFKNAEIACIANKVKKPERYSLFWWDYNNKTSRLAFIKWMIEQIKKEKI